MNNFEIDARMTVLVKTERKITFEILNLIRLAEDQRLPLERGFKDTYEWLIAGHGYSGAAANRRVQSSRLLREMPEIGEKIKNGLVNLTTLWQTQKAIRAQQKATGRKVTLKEKKEALAKIEGKTSEVAECELNTLFPDGVKSGERMVRKKDGRIGLFIELSAEDAAELGRARELLSHAMPGASMSEVIARLAREYNKRKDPLRKDSVRDDSYRKHATCGDLPQEPLSKESTPTKQQDAPQTSESPLGVTTPQCGTSWAQTQREVIQEAEGQCVYQDPVTGRVCGGRFQVEPDHIIPRAKGGNNEPSNLRCLCSKHNQLMAEIEFGREFMQRKRRGKSVGFEI